MLGETIGNFRIVSKLGRGGMGEVYAAEQISIHTRVVIKVLRPEVSQDPPQVTRFFNEAIAVSRIKHAGIAKIFDVGVHAPTGRAYLVMELLEGETLSARPRKVRTAHDVAYDPSVGILRRHDERERRRHTRVLAVARGRDDRCRPASGDG